MIYVLKSPRFIGEGNLYVPKYERSGRLANEPFIEILIEFLRQTNSSHAVNDDRVSGYTFGSLVECFNVKVLTEAALHFIWWQTLCKAH